MALVAWSPIPARTAAARAPWSPFRARSAHVHESQALFPPGYPEPPKEAWGSPPFCRAGSEPDEENGGCKPTFFCPDGFQRSHTTGLCDPENAEEYCGKGAVYDKTKGECRQTDCPPYFERRNEQEPCRYVFSGTPCCLGQAWDDPKGWKACPVTDRQWNDKGECASRDLPHCPNLYGPLSRYDADKGACVCPQGYVRSENPRGCVLQGAPKPAGKPEEAPERPTSSRWGWGLAGAALGAALTWFAWPSSPERAT